MRYQVVWRQNPTGKDWWYLFKLEGGQSKHPLASLQKVNYRGDTDDWLFCSYTPFIPALNVKAPNFEGAVRVGLEKVQQILEHQAKRANDDLATFVDHLPSMTKALLERGDEDFHY